LKLKKRQDDEWKDVQIQTMIEWLYYFYMPPGRDWTILLLGAAKKVLEQLNRGVMQAAYTESGSVA